MTRGFKSLTNVAVIVPVVCPSTTAVVRVAPDICPVVAVSAAPEFQKIYK